MSHFIDEGLECRSKLLPTLLLPLLTYLISAANILITEKGVPCSLGLVPRPGRDIATTANPAKDDVWKGYTALARELLSAMNFRSALCSWKVSTVDTSPLGNSTFNQRIQDLSLKGQNLLNINLQCSLPHLPPNNIEKEVPGKTDNDSASLCVGDPGVSQRKLFLES